MFVVVTVCQLLAMMVTMTVGGMIATMTTQPFITLVCHIRLVDFINFQDKSEVAQMKNSIFTQAQLLTIIPEQLCQLLKRKAYQILNPEPVGMTTQGQAQMLNFVKKPFPFCLYQTS